MVRKNKIRTIFLLPFVAIIFLIGWSLQFSGSSKKVEQRKKANYDLNIGVLEIHEPIVYQPIRN